MTHDHKTYTDNLVEALMSGQQCDEEGVMCIVSRQACHEAAARFRELEAEKEAAVKAAVDAAYKDAARLVETFGIPRDEFDFHNGNPRPSLAKAIRALIPSSVSKADRPTPFGLNCANYGDQEENLND